MPSRTDVPAVESAPSGSGPAAVSASVPTGGTPAESLAHACARERRGCLAEAIEGYQAAADAADFSGDSAVLAEALRRLAVVHHKSGNTKRARALCRRSYHVARDLRDDLLTAEALNTLGVVEMEAGALPRSREVFRRALQVGGDARAVRARVDQNLGILANIQGRFKEARRWYERSLAEYRKARDQHGCAIAYHNLGMVCTDAGRYDEADRHLCASLLIARRRGDRYLEALCLVNKADVCFARQGYENARQHAEEALALFDQLGAGGAKSDAYRIIGMVYREIGKPILAESRLRAAIASAVSAGSVLSEAESSRELALVYQEMGRNQQALACLHDAYRLFRRLDAQADLVYVGGRMAELETTYRAVVRAWGRSIESSDSYTFGHCERVAELAVATAQVMGFGEHETTTVLLGAFLHDVGMVRVPHEVLRKNGVLSDAERELLEMHPLWGVELLAGVEFPWPIKGIIRWHHERCDGSGYPDHLTAGAIPMAAQVVGIADCYDDLTAARSPGQGACHADEALAEIRRRAAWWAPEVVVAFEQVVGCPRTTAPAPPALH